MAYNASNTDVSHDALPSTFSLLPTELVIEVLAHTMVSKVPFDLQKFIELGARWHQEQATRAAWCSDESRSWFLDGLHVSQREHYLDWLAINGTSRWFRACGRLAFFSQKIFIVAPPLLMALQNGSCQNISVPDNAAIISRARHVIVPLLSRNRATHFMRISMYNAFTRIRVLSIQPFAFGDGDRILQPLESASTQMVARLLRSSDFEDMLLRGTPKRHSAPPELLSLLRGVDLELERMEVDLIHRDTGIWRRYVIHALAREVYPYLRLIGRHRARQRLGIV